MFLGVNFIMNIVGDSAENHKVISTYVRISNRVHKKCAMPLLIEHFNVQA